jgi:hypothetical protein
MYVVVFRMDSHDEYHTIIRPFPDSIKDRKSFLSEELCIPEEHIKSIKPVIAGPAWIEDTE